MSKLPRCEQPDLGGTAFCMRVARACIALDGIVDRNTGTIAEVLSRPPDENRYGFDNFVATTAAELVAQARELGTPQEIADRQVPPDQRCGACVMHLICNPPGIPDALPPES